MIGHGSLLNFLCSMREILGAGEQDSLLAVTTYSFDIAYLELFLMLTCGGTGDRGQPGGSDGQPSVDGATGGTSAYLYAGDAVDVEDAGGGGLGQCGAAVIMTGGEALPETLKDQLVGLGDRR